MPTRASTMTTTGISKVTPNARNIVSTNLKYCVDVRRRP